MGIKLQLFLIIFSLIFGLFVYIQISRKKLNLEYSIMWFLFAILMIISALFPGIISFLCNLVGIKEESNMVFLFGFIILIFIVLHLTEIISKQNNKITTLVQELSILKKGVKENDKNKRNN